MTRPVAPVRPGIGFICEASRQIGGGHVMRCLALAHEMDRQGAKVQFAVNDEARTIAPLLQRTTFPVAGVAARNAGPHIWSDQPDIVVFDSYEIDARIERAFKRESTRILVIDDLADRPHDCDLLIDSSWGRSAADYSHLVPAHTLVLTGPEFALLRPEFAAKRPLALRRRLQGGPPRRVLVSLGLTDVGGITGRIVTSLLDALGNMYCDVIIGETAASRAPLEQIAGVDRRVILHTDPSDVAELMTNADLAIGAGGTTTWERCCLGLPTIIVVLAGNQSHVASALEKTGAAVTIQGVRDADLRQLSTAFTALVEDSAAREAMTNASAKLVDGIGTHRVWSALQSLL